MNRVRYAVLQALAIATLAILMWVATFVLLTSGTQAAECVAEPESEWAPAGFICPPVYGEGTASTWPGPGVARNDCVWPWTACPTIRVTSLDTGLSITVAPTMWCHCYANAPGANGETQRIVDLDLASVEALRLDPSRGLWPVRVEQAGVLPDTAVGP